MYITYKYTSFYKIGVHYCKIHIFLGIIMLLWQLAFRTYISSKRNKMNGFLKLCLLETVT